MGQTALQSSWKVILSQAVSEAEVNVSNEDRTFWGVKTLRNQSSFGWAMRQPLKSEKCKAFHTGTEQHSPNSLPLYPNCSCFQEGPGFPVPKGDQRPHAVQVCWDIFFFLKIYLFIVNFFWGGATLGLSCGMCGLHWGMWDLSLQRTGSLRCAGFSLVVECRFQSVWAL